MLLLNGKWIEADAPELSLLNRSFKYGDGLFESLRVFEGKLLFWEDHWARLARGMEVLHFSFDAEQFEQLLLEAIQTFLSQNYIQDHGRLRLHIYRAGGGAYLPIDNQPFYLLEGYSLKHDPFQISQEVKVTDYQELKLPFNALSGIKTANSLPYILAARYAQEQGFDDALLYHETFISEASSSNIFWVKNKKLFTPPLTHGCLDGVMRKQIIALCKGLKLPITEKGLRLKELEQADEAFLTNSIRGIISIAQYKDLLFDVKKAGITSLLKRSLYQLSKQ